ncbi:MAG: hemolysin family protein [bacterium]
MSLTIFLIILICILLSALLAGTEMGILSLDQVKLRHEVRRGRKKALIVYDLVKNPSIVIICVLIGNNLFSVSAAVFTASEYKGHEFLSGIILAMIMLIFAEAIPKAIFHKKKNKLIIFIAPFLQLILKIFSPFLKMVSYLNKSLIEIEKKKENYFTQEKIRFFITKSKRKDLAEEREGEIFNKVFDLSKIEVKKIMTPRTNIICVEASADIKEIIKVFGECKYSRIPVYEENIDNIIGLIYIKDVLNFWEEKADFRAIEFIHIPFFVPEAKHIGDLLKEFRAKAIHIAIVVDEYGGTSGIVTLEDILEEMFGEIQDEHEQEKRQIKSLDKNTYLIEGSTAIKKIEEELQVNFPEEEDFETISGYILETLKYIPSIGEVIKDEKMRITIIGASKRSINKVKLEKLMEKNSED